MAKPWLSGEANGKWMGYKECLGCGAPARYKTAQLCGKCYDRNRFSGFVIGPPNNAGPRPVYPECVAQDCTKAVKGLGLCHQHYAQYRREVLHKPS